MSNDTVTFESGVLVGTRGAGSMTTAWFTGPVTQFPTFTLDLVSMQPLTGIQGMPARRKPVILRFTGSGLSTVEDDLHTVEAYPLLNGQPRRTLSGALDAVAGKGHLLRMSLSLLGDTTPRSEWGVLADLQVSIDGGNNAWSAVATFYPCDVLWHTGTDNVFAVPGVVPAPPEPEEPEVAQ